MPRLALPPWTCTQSDGLRTLHSVAPSLYGRFGTVAPADNRMESVMAQTIGKSCLSVSCSLKDKETQTHTDTHTDTHRHTDTHTHTDTDTRA